MYTERVLEAVGTLRDHVMPNFAEKVEMAVEALSSDPGRETDENEFIDASRLVYDGVRDIRRFGFFQFKYPKSVNVVH